MFCRIHILVFFRGSRMGDLHKKLRRVRKVFRSALSSVECHRVADLRFPASSCVYMYIHMYIKMQMHICMYICIYVVYMYICKRVYAL